ncbi:MAG: hypothetical protein Q9215_005865 [Flavoplaca cf. flavocitrina]
MAYTYALVDQKDGLRSAWRLPSDRCFFFPEFRDDELTTISERKAAWNKLIREAEDDSTINSVEVRIQPQEIRHLRDSVEKAKLEILATVDSLSQPDTAALYVEGHNWVRLQYGELGTLPKVSRPAAPTSSKPTNSTTLEERYNQALKSLVSDDLGADPHNIWANFAGSMDFGRMKLWAMQAHRWIAKQLVAEDVGNLTKLIEFAEMLEKLRRAVS